MPAAPALLPQRQRDQPRPSAPGGRPAYIRAMKPPPDHLELAAGLPVAALGQALDGVYLEFAPVALDAGAQTGAAAEALLRLAAERGLACDQVSGNLGADPIGLAARTGDAPDLGMLTALAEQAA